MSQVFSVLIILKKKKKFDEEYLPYFYPLLNKIVSDFIKSHSIALPNPCVSEFLIDNDLSNSHACVYYLNSNNTAQV